MKNLVLIFFTIFFFLGCSSKQIKHTNISHLNLDDKKNYTIKYARDIFYNKEKNTLSYNRLSDTRPTNGNFKILYFEKNLLKMSFDISIKDKNKFEPLKPVEHIVHSSAKGFILGVESIGNNGATNDIEVLVALPIITTIGEFIVGIITSIPSVIEELKDLIIVNKQEYLNYNTIYLYDKHNKLTHKFKG